MNRILFLWLGVCFANVVHAQSTLTETLKNIKQTALLKQGAIGLSVVDVSSQKIIYDYQAHESFAPASNLKLISTATALNVLGADYRFETNGLLLGKIDSLGVLNGDMLIKGAGDPTLGSERINASMNAIIQKWVQELTLKRIKKVNGNIVIDVSAFDVNPVPDFWPWTDLGNYYGAGIYALNANENMMQIYFQQNTVVGQPVNIVKTQPEFKALQFDNYVVSGAPGSKDLSCIYGGPHQLNRFITGTIPAGTGIFKVKGSIPNPPMYMGELLKDVLLQNQIAFNGEVKIVYKPSKNESNALPWFTHTSPPLKEMIKYTNFASLNLYAECLFQAIALKNKGKGERAWAVHEVKKHWSARGIDTTGWILLDGSGLSALNAISPKQMAKVLNVMAQQESFKDFEASIPLAGKEGTVAWFGKNSSIQERAHIKSGSFKGTLCYSGYIKTNSNKHLAFSLMMNKYEGEQSDASKHLLKVLEELMKL